MGEVDAKDEMIASFVDSLHSLLSRFLSSLSLSPPGSLSDRERSLFLVSVVDETFSLDERLSAECLYPSAESLSGMEKLERKFSKLGKSPIEQGIVGNQKGKKEKEKGKEKESLRKRFLPAVSDAIFGNGSPYISQWIDAEKKVLASKLRTEEREESFWDSWNTCDSESAHPIQIFQSTIRIVAHLLASLKKRSRIRSLPLLFWYQSSVFASVAADYLARLRSKSEEVLRSLRRSHSLRSEPDVFTPVCILLNSIEYLRRSFEEWEREDTAFLSSFSSPSSSLSLPSPSPSPSASSSLLSPRLEITCAHLMKEYDAILNEAITDETECVLREMEGVVRSYFQLSWNFSEPDLSTPEGTTVFLELIQYFQRNLSFLRDQSDRKVYARVGKGVGERVDDLLFQRIRDQKGKVSEYGAKQMDFDFQLLDGTFRALSSLSSRDSPIELKKTADAVKVLSLSQSEFLELRSILDQAIADQSKCDDKKRGEMESELKMRLKREFSVTHLPPHTVRNIMQCRKM